MAFISLSVCLIFILPFYFSPDRINFELKILICTIFEGHLIHSGNKNIRPSLQRTSSTTLKASRQVQLLKLRHVYFCLNIFFSLFFVSLACLLYFHKLITAQSGISANISFCRHLKF